MIKIMTFIAAVAAVLALAACGGGDSSSPPSGAEPSAAESADAAARQESGAGPAGEVPELAANPVSMAAFVMRANKICYSGGKVALAKMQGYLKQHAAEGEVAEREAIREFFLPHVEAEVGEIAALGTPKGSKTKVEAFLSTLLQNAKAARSASPGAFNEVPGPFQRSGVLALQLHLKACDYSVHHIS